MKEFIKEALRNGLIMEQRTRLNINIPSDILAIKDVFKKNGFKLYLVGGAVRDALLGKEPKDFDLATDAIPDRVEEIMSKAGFRTLPTGKSFGVINVFTDQGEYEIATFREDSSTSDGRRPDSVTFTNIENDVKRRDLTINALFYDIDTQEVVDLVGGVNDLKNGVVRTVGNPEERFNEDRLRILRAIRFAARFGSELDPAVDAVLKNDASLKGISGERIRDEFLKGIASSKSVVFFLKLIDKYGLFDWIFKGLPVNKEFIEERDPIIVLAKLLDGVSDNVLNKKLNELKYTFNEIKDIRFLLSLRDLNATTAVKLKRNQKNVTLSDEQIRKFANLEGLDKRMVETFLRFKLTVNGDEVKAKYNLSDGPDLGIMIYSLETANFKKML